MDNVLYLVWNDPVLTTAVFLLASRICCIRTLCAGRQIICVHANDQSFKVEVHTAVEIAVTAPVGMWVRLKSVRFKRMNAKTCIGLKSVQCS